MKCKFGFTVLCKGFTLPLRTVSFPHHTIDVWNHMEVYMIYKEGVY